MHIITRKRLNDFLIVYPEVKTALQHWYRIMKYDNFNSFNELKVLSRSQALAWEPRTLG